MPRRIQRQQHRRPVEREDRRHGSLPRNHFWPARSHRKIQSFHRRLARRTGPGWSFRNPIATSRAYEMRSIGQQRFARQQGDFLACPIDVIAQPIRDVHLAGRMEPHHARRLRAKICIMYRHDGVVLQGLFQLFLRVRSSRNHRVGVDRSIFLSERRRCERRTPIPIQREGPRLFCSIGW